MKAGKVYLIGAGPGDYRLMTLKGLDIIQGADVVLYDRLVNNKLLRYAREDAELIYVGKAPDNHTYSQEEINELLIKKASEGKSIARIKGGDPFVFGRGGEEALALNQKGIEFEIVPGVTSAIAAPAYAGIPVTHRNVSSSFHVITGHEDQEKDGSSVNYEALGKLKGTLIFLMGIKNLKDICINLVKYGQPQDRPVAVIMRGTTVDQRVVRGTLGNIVNKVEEHNITNPSIIIVGEVVNLAETLAWYENKPLFGKRILVTRTRQQASSLSEKLESLGGEAVEFPTIRIGEPPTLQEIDKAIGEIEKYQWIMFTSVNGVKAFFDRMKKLDFDIRLLNGAKICAIGPITAKALEDMGFIVEYIPEEYRAEAIVEGLKDKIAKGDQVLLPRADIAREVLKEELIKLGAIVDNIHVYSTTLPKENRQKLIDLLKGEYMDIITFTSSSTLNNFIEILGTENLNLLKDIRIAAIGPITENSIKQAGLKVDILAEEYTIDGLVHSILQFFTQEGINENNK